MHPLLLTFSDPELEAAWWADQASRGRAAHRRAIVALLGVVVCFGVVDRLAFPDQGGPLLAIRAAVFGLVAAVLPVFFGPEERLRRWGQAALLWAAVVTLGALWPFGRVVAPTATPEQLLLAAPALVFGLLALFGASGLRFALAAPLGLAVVVAFPFALRGAAEVTTEFLLVTGAGGVSALAVGAFVRWSRESHARTDFLQRREVDRERLRSETLLRLLVPDALARKLAGGPGPHLERAHAAVLFATVVGHEDAGHDPLAAVGLLDRVIGAIDDAAVAAGVERVKTIGATVLLVAGVPTPEPDPLGRAVGFALDLRGVVARAAALEGVPLRLRCGLAVGPVVWGVVGRTRFAFDVWGDVVNTASRLESHGAPGRLHVAGAVGDALRGIVLVEDRGEVPIKGKGRMRTAWVEPLP